MTASPLISAPGIDAQRIASTAGADGGVTSLVEVPAATPLAQVLAALTAFGFTLVSHSQEPVNGETTRHQLGLAHPIVLPTAATLAKVDAAVEAALIGQTDLDEFAELVVVADLTWREVSVLRAATRHSAQTGLGASVFKAAKILVANPEFAQAAVDYFTARFNPELVGREEPAEDAAERMDEAIAAAPTAQDDRVLRAIAAFMRAALRTNYFRPDADTRRIAVKLDPSLLANPGAIVPLREIYVMAPEVEGVHVRSALVARGGLRWSDRPADFRSEALALMRTQSLKNSGIVPDGAKGAFVVRGSHRPEAVTEAYKTFIRGLLDVVDNIEDGQITTPEGVVAYDGPDTYLVVAADKGTARLSDTANSLAALRGYWLGDAFASGGSAGYDHKAMGITARGAWELVRRRFTELEVDVDADGFTVAGVGDMSGDVFGNGMLLSESAALVAAFDHRHIFLDPAPDVEAAYAERRRLYELPGSSWADFDRSLISRGGGVWARTERAIPLSDAARRVLGVDAEELAPAQLISAILRARVDLLWLGGVGTYVKAAGQSHRDAGDPGNDHVRVDGADVRARVVGEGANLGFTPAARNEYAAGGGLIAGDFIDNAAGVATSDKEVNIKIALRTAGIEPERAAELFAAATDEVAEQVLEASRDTSVTLAMVAASAPELLRRHERLIEDVVDSEGLDRVAEALPSTREINRRAQAGEGFSVPELAVLLSHSKNQIAGALEESGVVDDPFLDSVVRDYFPASIVEAAGDALQRHPLRGKIAAVQVVRKTVGAIGPGGIVRLEDRYGCTTAECVRAYLVAAEVIGAEATRARILASSRGFADKIAALRDHASLLETVTGMLLRYRIVGDLTETAERFAPLGRELRAVLRER